MTRTTLAASIAAASLIFCTTMATAEEHMNDAATTNSAAPAAVLVLVPLTFAKNDNLGDGCWARLYDKPNHYGSMLTLTGPLSVPETGEGIVAGSELGRNMDSLSVGPNATLQVWDDEEYEGKTQTFAGGQKVANLDERMGIFDNIRSIRLACNSSTPVAQSD